MNENKSLEAEKREVNTLINKGVKFEVEEVKLQRVKGIFAWVRKRTPVTITHTFYIYEPTLQTLDLITAESIEMNIDESVMSSTKGISEAKLIASEHSRRCAKVIAITVLGRDYIPTKKSAIKKLNELTNLFFHTIKPSQLVQLILLINTMMNLGDFMNSIRLISASRTTMPDRIEVKQKD